MPTVSMTLMSVAKPVPLYGHAAVSICQHSKFADGDMQRYGYVNASLHMAEDLQDCSALNTIYDRNESSSPISDKHA